MLGPYKVEGDSMGLADNNIRRDWVKQWQGYTDRWMNLTRDVWTGRTRASDWAHGVMGIYRDATDAILGGGFSQWIPDKSHAWLADFDVSTSQGVADPKQIVALSGATPEELSAGKLVGDGTDAIDGAVIRFSNETKLDGAIVVSLNDVQRHIGQDHAPGLYSAPILRNGNPTSAYVAIRLRA